jgi:hypothetical protein
MRTVLGYAAIATLILLFAVLFVTGAFTWTLVWQRGGFPVWCPR